MVYYNKQDNRNTYVPVAQLDRVFGYEPKGRGFESLQARHKKEMIDVISLYILYFKMLYFNDQFDYNSQFDYSPENH